MVISIAGLALATQLIAALEDDLRKGSTRIRVFSMSLTVVDEHKQSLCRQNHSNQGN